MAILFLPGFVAHFLKFQIVWYHTVTATINMIPVDGNISRKALYIYVCLEVGVTAGSWKFWPVTLNSLWTHKLAFLSSLVFL